MEFLIIVFLVAFMFGIVFGVPFVLWQNWYRGQKARRHAYPKRPDV